MKFSLPIFLASLGVANSFAPLYQGRSTAILPNTKTALQVSIGLGPEAEEQGTAQETPQEEVEVVIPDSELFRDSRLTDFDRKCDDWYGALLGDRQSFLGPVSEEACRRLDTLVKLDRPVEKVPGDEDWTPYQVNALPTSPILPSYGLEQYGLPIPRRNAEAWRHYDVPGLIGTDYSGTPAGVGTDLALEESQVNQYKDILKAKGAWIDDEECSGRLVYVNGRFAPALSVTSDIAKNLCSDDFASGNVSDEMVERLNHLPDGFTDRLAADVPSGESEYLTSLKALSGPDHNVGEPTSQFAINNQQGTACFVALNSVRAGSVACVDVPAGETATKPVLVINAITADGGLGEDSEVGVANHPRSFVSAGDNSKVSFLQSFVDLDAPDAENCNQKFVNSCTQIYVGGGANVTHSYIEETGGVVTGAVELTSADEEEGQESPRVVESKRKALRDSHFESIDVHVVGDDGAYEGAIMTVGGNGRSRISISTTLLKPGTHAAVNGFSLAGGAQRTDMRTNIHHIAQGTTSRQSQKNMVGGRATSTFKGRIRVDQSAQQTDSEQLARTVLLSDKARIWAIPSLEIIADDVTCTHGATVSDLSEEELFYLRSRGLDRTTSRNILMYAFVDEIGACIDPAIQGGRDDPDSLKNRVIRRLQNVVPQGERAIKGEFQSV